MNSLRDKLYNHSWSPHRQPFHWYRLDHWPTGDTWYLMHSGTHPK